MKRIPVFSSLVIMLLTSSLGYSEGLVPPDSTDWTCLLDPDSVEINFGSTPATQSLGIILIQFADWATNDAAEGDRTNEVDRI